MSAGDKRPLSEAISDAEAFRALFPAECCERWEIAGSIRRKVPMVSDVEHVVIPRFGDKPGAGLFADQVNLLWHRLEELVAGGELRKHIYGDTGFRWGDKQRGVDFRDHLHEFWTACAENWGNILTIRTGSTDFSHRMVTQAQRYGLRQDVGFMWRGDERIACPDEETFFSCCGERWIEPERRSS